MSKVGERLIAAAKEARAIAAGEKEAASTFIPADIDVRGIRRALKLSQDDFAAEFGFSVNQIRDWEQHRSRPIGGVRAYLMIIKTNPDLVRNILRKAAASSDIAA